MAKNKKVTWGENQKHNYDPTPAAQSLEDIQQGLEQLPVLAEAIESYNLQQIITLIQTINEEVITVFCTQFNTAPLEAIFIGFVCKIGKTDNEGDEPLKEKFLELLRLLCEKIGTDKVSEVFHRVQNLLIEESVPGFPPDILNEFARISNEHHNHDTIVHYAFLETFSFDSMQPLNIDSKAILGNLDFIQNIENMDKNHIPSQSCLVVGFNFTASSFNHSEATNRNDLPSIENPYILFIGDSSSYHTQ